MIELHPGQVARVMRRDGYAGRGGALLSAAMSRRGRPVWGNEHGCHLLVRWSGERLPLPSLDPGAERVAAIVGQAFAGDTEILTWSGVTHAASTVYHYAVVPISGGGVIGPTNLWIIKTRAVNAAGQLLGLLPNPPSALQGTTLPGRLPLLRWCYAAFQEQAAPATFAVCAAVGAAEFDFGTPAGSVAYARGQTHYEWTGAALAAGTQVHYTVRAVTSGGLLSLIPRVGLCPSGSYTSVDKSHCVKLVIPSGPPAAPASVMSEVAS